MDQCNKDLGKKPINWTDLEKQLPSLQTRIGTSLPIGSTLLGPSTTATNTQSLAINKLFVKQCTDLLIKHIKKLNQAQVIDQLENLATTCNLLIFKHPSEEDPNTVNAFLTTDDFYFEVTISLSGEITDAKFSIFSEPATSSSLLKEIFCSWNWDLLSKHIEGIKSNFILTDPDQQVRATGFKAIQCLEKDLCQLYHIELKYLEKITNNNLKQSQIQSSHSQNNQSKFLDKLINHTPIGIYKKSELGEPFRLYYYLSPLDLIQHHQNLNSKQKQRHVEFDSTFKTITNSLTLDDLFNHEIGSYLSISLQKSPETTNENRMYKLADSNLLVLTDKDDERKLYEYLNPYLNQNFNFEKNPLFYKSPKQLNPNSNSSINIPATYQVKLNKPLVMCLSTLNQLNQQLGIETQTSESDKLTPFFELLAKTAINNKVLNDAYSVQLPDENQVYYITELDETNCMGVIIEKIAFTHPQDLLLIIETLRKQLLFNELLLSCMRKLCTSALNMSNNNYNLTNYNYSNLNNPNVRILEIGLISPFVVSVIMQHPKLLCYTTIEIDVSKGNVETRFRDHNDLHNPNVISEIIRRCHSIPVTIRALLMKYKQNPSLDQRRKINNNNYPDDNGKNSKNNPNDSNKSGNEENFDDNDQNMAPESEYIESNIDEMHVTPRGNSYPMRLTPSRRDSYNPSNNPNTPTSCSLFDFSNSLEQKNKPKIELTIKNEAHFEEDIKTEPEDDSKNDLEKSKCENINKNNIKSNNLIQTPSDSSGPAKKRKASSSSTSESVPSTPVVSTNPPSAKRKMTQNQPTDIKRHNSMNEDTKNLNGSSLLNKKQKLKPSLSSVDIATEKKSENSSKKNDISTNQKTPQNPVPKKESSVLTTSNSANKKESIEKKSSNSNPKTPSSTVTPSSSIKKPSNSTPNQSQNSTQNSSQNSTPGTQKSGGNSNPSRTKPLSDDGLKSKISKDIKSQKSSTPTGTGKNLNLSSTEIQLKQSQLSPQVNLSTNNLSNSSTEKIKESQSNHRTPSPSPSSLSSLSISTSLMSPSNEYLNSDLTDSNLKYEPTLISKPKLKQIKESEMKKNSKSSDTPQLKPSTPPLTNNKPNLALSLGLGLGLKGGFKIPHKTKTTDEDDNPKNPLSASSPIIKNSLGSPNKSSSSPQYDPTAPTLVPVKNLQKTSNLNQNSNQANNNSKNRSSFSAVQSKNNSSITNSGSNKSTQRTSSSSSRPTTPVQGSQNRSNNSQNSTKTNPLPPVPLMSSTKIQPLMSFNSLSTIQSSDMTPSSPSPQEEQVNLRATSGTPQPPDSPVCETTPNSVKPKLIPLERNTGKTNHSSGKNNLTSPDLDEEDDDNLVIDCPNSQSSLLPTFSTRNLNSSNNEILSSMSITGQSIPSYVSSTSTRINKQNKSPAILDEDLVNEALAS
ncbi:unnamed protein product [Brachionus calyciflorus]|uniref:Mediator of RNA polymerase II transcription subunit 1 n=1 Tax=Brachionus calyciflorus TaxID=104777 RepID=A0A813M6E5_9BILA|nr:unnamed protein product [Brachionus calyciflorus]